MKFALQTFKKNSFIQIGIIVFVCLLSLAAFPLFQLFTLTGPTPETGIPQPLPEITVDSFGNANASFPIPVPKGTKDITPNLGIEYNSLQNDGLIGGGWDLSGIMTISLDSTEGIHNDSGDSYVSFAGKLIQTSPGIYHTKIESFFQFRKLADSWIVQDRNGVSYYFGEDGSAENPGSNSTLRNLNGKSRIWALNRVRDLNGNGYNIKYRSYSSSNGTPIPQLIEYNQGNTVILFQDEDRTDAVESNSLNLQSILTKRLRSISVTQKQDDGSVVESERYTFNYNNNFFDKKNRLTSLDRKNYGPIAFNYNDDAPNPAESSTSKSSPSLDMSYRYENTAMKPDCDFTNAVCACSANATCMAISGGFAGLACVAYVNSVGDVCTKGVVGSQTFLATFERNKAPEPVWIQGEKQKNKLMRYDSSNPGSTIAVAQDLFNLNEKSKVLQGDVDGDLLTDFFVLENDNVNAYLKLGKSGSFSSIGIPAILRSSENSFQGLADLNSDGRSDFIQTDDSGNFLIYLATGSISIINTNPISLSIPGIGSTFRQFIDMDADGIADYVRLSDNPDGSKNLNISYLRYSSGSFSIRANVSSNISVAGTEGDRFLADSNGDGYLDLITFSGNNLYVYLSDGHSLRSPVNFPVSFTTQYMEVSSGSVNGKRYSMRDMNWDGKDDRISLISNGFQIDLFNPNTGSYDSSFQVSNDGSQITHFDVNWDGNSDSISFYTFFFNGTGFHVKNGSDNSNTDVVFDYNETTPVPPNPALLASDRDAMYSNFVNSKSFADVDGDNKADFIRFYGGNIYVSYSRSKNNGLFYSNGGDSVFPASSFSLATDTNQDGRADFIGFRSPKKDLVVPSLVNNILSNERNTIAHENLMSIDYVETKYSRKISQGLLTDIFGTQQKGIQISYANTYDFSNPSVANSINFNALSSFLKPNLTPYSVATNVYSQVADGVGEADSFTFENGRIYVQDQDNRSLLGFAKVTSANSRTGERIISLYQGTNPNLAGIETNKDEYLNNHLMSSTVSTFTSLNSVFGTINIRKTQESITKYQNNAILTNYNTDYTFDQYNNILSKVVQIDSDPTLTLREDTVYNPSLADWVLSEIVQQTKSQGGVLSSHVEFTYSNHRLADQRTLIKQGTTQYSIFSILAYDGFGNPTILRDPNGNLTNLEYDFITNSYVTNTINSLGHQQKKTYDYVFGKELTSTDANGNESRNLYDFYGRKIGIKYAGETDWSEIIDYIQSGSPSGEKVKRTISDPKTGDFYVQESHDAFGRTIKTEKLVADAVVFSQDTTYNSNGTISSKTEPYLGSVPFLTTFFTYDSENNVTRTSDSAGRVNDISYSGFNTTTLTSVSGTLIETIIESKNQLGQLITKTKNGKSIGYAYNSQGIANRITDPEGKSITLVHDLLGNKISQTTPDTGTTTFVNSPTGKVLQQNNANGFKTDFQYDTLDRLTNMIGTHANGTTQNAKFYYDEATSLNGKGNLTSVVDAIGKTDFQHDARGNQTQIKKYLNLEDLTLIFLKEYDFGNRAVSITYPDGTKIYNKFTVGGYLTSVNMDSADGSSTGHPVVNYTGPLLESGKYNVLRSLGNGVQTKIFFDPIFRRPTDVVTTFESDLYESLKYGYDLAENIIKIDDLKNPGRNQQFQYDQFKRVTNSTGKYGSEDYQYTDAGNLLKKGANTYSYNGSSTHAVTQISSPSGPQYFSYDASGLMTNRDGDTLEYDPMALLHKMFTKDGEVMTFDNDYTGSRVRKSKQSDGSSVINIDGLYEISFRPGFPPLHTVYIKGIEDELVSQIGLQNVSLLTENHISSKETVIASAILNPKESLCKGVSIDCFQFYKNRLLSLENLPTTLSWVFDIQDGRIGNQFRLGIISVFGIIVIGFVGLVLYGKPRFGNLKPTQAGVTPFLILSVFISFNFFSCGMLPGTGSKNGDPPWIALPSTIPVDTPSVSNPGVGGGSGSNPGGSPVPGMIFFHPNHLGSIVMATNGAGKPISGGSAVGTSYVSYKPYGEILRTDSYGPDAFRYKYAGQEEDKETGLLFYKSRYYDPGTGRFLQSDSVVNGSSLSGSNLFMYVDGNPLQYNDPTGKNAWIHMLNRIIGHMMGKHFGDKDISKRVSTGGVLNGLGRATFVPNSFFKRFENKTLGNLVGSGKITNWVKQNVNFQNVKDVLEESLTCNGSTSVNPACGPLLDKLSKVKIKPVFVQLKVQVAVPVSFKCDIWDLCKIKIDTPTVFIQLKVEKGAVTTGFGGGGCDVEENGKGYKC
ncbi:RHS repeat-associated core domain-containing protein [Leptospira kmetyi]|uniref:RHS repeat-associated core domain-containing protein n=1 Tax=Leptospira kmetyi TaxID=408139 RepID=UPI000390572F|nr:RHS repeat-associated core domain-containing protein [Leptospira kmetyi]EQA55418.1 RHS repeat-associated core domain protein [Leptospira kmetyi serovar Malaysia str. Bejo-Iso9]